jgi:hypothetical protein
VSERGWCARCNGVGVGPDVVSMSRDGGSKDCGSSGRRFGPGGPFGRSSAGSVNWRRRSGIVVGEKEQNATAQRDRLRRRETVWGL